MSEEWKIGRFRICWGTTHHEKVLCEDLSQKCEQLIDCREALELADTDAKKCRKRAGELENVFDKWEALPPGMDKVALLRAFGQLKEDGLAIRAFKAVVSRRLNEARMQGTLVEMADRAGELAHCAGGQCWLEQVLTDIGKLWAVAQAPAGTPDVPRKRVAKTTKKKLKK